MTQHNRPIGPNTSAKSRAKQDLLKKSKTLILPNQSDNRQRWLLVRLWPLDNRQGEFFVTHAENLPKFEKDSRFKVHMIANDRERLTVLARQMTLEAGPAYQPPSSAIHRLPPPTGPDPEDLNLPTTLPTNQETKK